MKYLIFALALNWLCAVPTQGAEGNKLPRVEQRLPDDIGKRLADQVPHPIPTSPNSSPTPTSVREQVFKRFATWQGLLVAAVTLALTLFICRPRGQKPHALNAPTKPRTLIEEFRASMSMNYERWHDGIGYDLNLLDKASPDERAEIETLLLVEPVTDWRIVEGLCRLRTPVAIARIQSALASSCDHEVKMAIIEYAVDLIPVEQRTAALIVAVREAPLVKGLHLALRQLTKFHPPEIGAELLRATLQREGDVAMHCAAYLLVIHGKSRSLFDDEHRAFLARFATNIPDERAVVHQELISLLGASNDSMPDETIAMQNPLPPTALPPLTTRSPAPRSLIITVLGWGLLLIGVIGLPISVISAAMILVGSYGTKTIDPMGFITIVLGPLILATTGFGLLLRWKWARVCTVGLLIITIISQLWNLIASPRAQQTFIAESGAQTTLLGSGLNYISIPVIALCLVILMKLGSRGVRDEFQRK